MRAGRTLLLMAVLSGASGWAGAQPLDESAERARIARERAAAQETLRAQEADCRQRFAVTACIEDARRAQRDTLERLRREQSLLDEAARKRRAAQRMATIHEQLERRDAMPPAAVASDAASAPQRPRGRVHETVRSPAAAASGAGAGPGAASAPDRSAAEAEARARFESRQREARERRAANERRAAERAATGHKPVAPLPVPPGASAP